MRPQTVENEFEYLRSKIKELEEEALIEVLGPDKDVRYRLPLSRLDIVIVIVQIWRTVGYSYRIVEKR